MPKFSVIIPAYNSARFVGHAVASAIRQTYRDLEIVVIDDGSSDQTGEIVERCRDSRTRVARRPNGGAAVARNDGISLTDSEFVAFLDADDIWSPRYLQAQGERLLHEPQTAMTFCFSSAVNASGRPMGITFAPSDNRLGEISPFTVMLSNPIVCASVLFRFRRFREATPHISAVSSAEQEFLYNCACWSAGKFIKGVSQGSSRIIRGWY
jgi:glycosyltransferase involved in cell wall biosynthesis